MSLGKCYACGAVGEVGTKIGADGACVVALVCLLNRYERNEEWIRRMCDEEINRFGRLRAELAVDILKVLDGGSEKEEVIDEVDAIAMVDLSCHDEAEE